MLSSGTFCSRMKFNLPHSSGFLCDPPPPRFRLSYTSSRRSVVIFFVRQYFDGRILRRLQTSQMGLLNTWCKYSAVLAQSSGDFVYSVTFHFYSSRLWKVKLVRMLDWHLSSESCFTCLTRTSDVSQSLLTPPNRVDLLWDNQTRPWRDGGARN